MTTMTGPGGAPTRCSTFPENRKSAPVASGVLDYFPDAIAAVARVSFQGNEQHNPGQPLHWARSKSGDESDALMRHFLQRGTLDTDGMRHSAKVAWRALALLQKELEAASRVTGGILTRLSSAELQQRFSGGTSTAQPTRPAR